jgi:hypothetical protein
MAIIASILAYLGTVASISIGLLVLVCVFFAPPHPSTLLSHVQRTAAAQTEPEAHKASLSRLHKAGSQKQSMSASRADSRAVSHTNCAARTHYAVDGVPALLRQKSRARENEWAYRREPTGFPRRASYAQELSSDTSHTW